MSKGPGRAERAVIRVTTEAKLPSGYPRWLTIDEVAVAGGYRIPLTRPERSSLSRAIRTLAKTGTVEMEHAGNRWTPDKATVPPWQLRPELRKGTLLVRSATLTETADQDVSRFLTELIEESSSAKFPQYQREGAAEQEWLANPDNVDRATAREHVAELRNPDFVGNKRRGYISYDMFNLARGEHVDYASAYTRPAGLEALEQMPARSTRSGELRSESTYLPPRVERPDEMEPAPPAPKPFSREDVEQLGGTVEDDGYVQWTSQREDRLTSVEVETPRDNREHGELWGTEPEADRPDWEQDLVSTGQLDPYWYSEDVDQQREARRRHLDRQDEVRHREHHRYLLEIGSEVPCCYCRQIVATTCTRCTSPAVLNGACSLHLCENCRQAPWKANRRCTACAEYSRTHSGKERPRKLWRRPE